MALYEYRCSECGNKKEEFRSVEARDNLTKCPNCGTLMRRQLFPAEQVWLTVGRAAKITYPPSELKPNGDI